MLFGEIITPDELRIAAATVSGTGGTASFTRHSHGSLRRLKRFLAQHGNDHGRYNYAGEWHSHPRFALGPSVRDAISMRGILDEVPYARFAALLIVRLQLDQLETRAFVWQWGCGEAQELPVIPEPAEASVQCRVRGAR